MATLKIFGFNFLCLILSNKESEQQLTINIVGQENIAISKSQIVSRETVPQSMMPVGLLNALTEQEVLDLVAYLQTTEPLESLD